MCSASRARNLARCPHCVLSPLSSVAVHACVATAAVGVICGHAGRRCHRGCQLRPWVLSPLPRVSSVAVGVAAAAICIVCGCGCCRRRHASRCSCACCCCGPRVSPLLPCASSAAMNVAAAAAARVVCGRECCRRCACHLWP